MGVKIPATGTGDTTPTVASEKIAGTDFQLFKLVDGRVGGSQPATVDASGRVVVSGYVGASVPGGYVGASIANLPATQPVSGYVGASVANLTATQPVTGYLGASVSNFPATQPISGYVGASLAGGFTGASVSNFPATQAISGYVGASVPGGYVGASLAGGYVGASIANAVTVSGSQVNMGGSVAAAPIAAAVGGAGPFHFITGASVNNVNVKTTAGTLYSLSAFSIASQARFVKLYDKATTPSVGQDIPVWTQVVPGAPSPLVGNQTFTEFPVGLRFAAGIGIGTTLVYTDADKTSVGASDIGINLSYF